MLPTIPLLIFGAWFRWELQPFERYYLPAYWESSEGVKQPGSTTQIEWLYKVAPGRKSKPVIDVDVVSEGPWSLSLELSSSAQERGWIRLDKNRPEAVNSAEFEVVLQKNFYGHRSFRQMIAEPLHYARRTPFLVLYFAFMMTRVLGIEWNRLREEVSESALTFHLAATWSEFARRIRSWMRRRIVIEKARLQRSYSAIKTVPHFTVIPGRVRQAETSSLIRENQHLPITLQRPPTKPLYLARSSICSRCQEQSETAGRVTVD